MAGRLRTALNQRRRFGNEFEVLLLALPRHDPGIGGYIGNRVSVGGDELAPGEPTVKYAIEPIGLLDVAFDCVGDLFGRILPKMVVLSGHGAEPANLPEHPLKHLRAVAQIGREENARLVGEIGENCAGLRTPRSACRRRSA